MSPRRKRLLAVSASLCLLVGTLWFFNGPGNPQQRTAREKLDGLLGRQERLPDTIPPSPGIMPPLGPPSGDDSRRSPLPPDASPFPPGILPHDLPPFAADPADPGSGPGLPGDHDSNRPSQPGGNPFGFPFPLPQPGVEVKERADAYELRVPLAEPRDESSVKLNVQPHRIEISGQTGKKDGGLAVTSSFMQSFSTSEELAPDKLSRRTETRGDETALIITIPKKHPGQGVSPPDDKKAPLPGNTPPNRRNASPVNDALLPAPTHDTI